MKNKNFVKKVAVASLAALISISNIVSPTPVQAAYNQEEGCWTSVGNIVSANPQGNYTLITDEDGEQGLVHTNQWNEYQLMLQQGSPKVINIWTKGFSSESYGYYGIIAYQLEGQKKVTLPENAAIKVTDFYNLDHLSVLKYLGNQLGSSYLFNVDQELQKEEQKIKQENARIAAEYAKEREYWEKENAILDKYKEAQNFEKSSNHNDFLKYREQKVIELRDNLNARLRELSLQSIDDLHNVRTLVQKFFNQNGYEWNDVVVAIDIVQGTNDDSWDDYIKNWLKERVGKMTKGSSEGNKLFYLLPGAEYNGKPIYGYTYLSPYALCQQLVHNHFLTNENYDKFESEAITKIKNCYEDVKNNFPNMTSFELADLAKKISSYLKHYGTEADTYIMDLVESTAVSQEDLNELARLKKEAEEYEQSIKGSDEWVEIE